MFLGILFLFTKNFQCAIIFASVAAWVDKENCFGRSYLLEQLFNVIMTIEQIRYTIAD